MKLPIEWLNDYVEWSEGPKPLADLLARGGFPVDAIEEVDGDPVLDVDVTSNRADAVCVMGLAREVALLGRRPWKAAAGLAELETPTSNPLAPVGVVVEAADLCPRYIARRTEGIRVGRSPDWLERRLRSVGLRPVNNVVDVTNFVLFETGQPLHAFDYARLQGGGIRVRRARDGETIAAIDGKTYRLATDMLVIADARDPVAIAGVMGGKGTEVGDRTTDILLESAQFDPVSVRRTSRRLGLASDSSYRFERGVDFHGAEWASVRAMSLIRETAGGRPSSTPSDVAAAPPEPRRIVLRPERVRRVLGMDVPAGRVREICLGIGCEADGSGAWTAPTRRRDLREEIDLIEEIARVEGYDRVPVNARIPIEVPVLTDADLVEPRARRHLLGCGLHEVLTPSFLDDPWAGLVDFWTTDPVLQIISPKGDVRERMRSSVVPALLLVQRTNEGYGHPLSGAFEIAKSYRKGEGGIPVERTRLAVLTPGGFLRAKGIVRSLLADLGLPAGEAGFAPANLAFATPGRTAEFRLGGERAGFVADVSPEILTRLDLRHPVAVAELDWEAVLAAVAAHRTRPFRPFSRFPVVRRDLAVVVKDDVPWAEIERTARSAAPPTLRELRFFDVFRGGKLPAGTKSVAFRMSFQADDRTLTGEEAARAVEAVAAALAAGLGASLRTA